MTPPFQNAAPPPAGITDPAKMTPAERRAEIVDLLARGVLRALRAAPEESPESGRKSLEEGAPASADPRDGKETP